MSISPFFSIVIPTLNRAKFLPFAIRNALNQTFEDFELVISNNSSSDETEDIVHSFDDPRIRYVKTNSQIPMPNHWDFALSHARGEYVTFLGDDDAHSDIFLDTCFRQINAPNASGIEIVAVSMCDYYYKKEQLAAGEISPENALLVKKFDNSVKVLDSEKVLSSLFLRSGLMENGTPQTPIMPLLLNAVYHQSVFEKVEKKLGHIFLHSPHILSSDYYLAVTMLNASGKCCCIDSPLSIHGYSPSGTSRIQDKAELDLFRAKFPQYTKFRHVPFKTPYQNNLSTEAMLEAYSLLKADLGYINLDFTGYFTNLYGILENWELQGYNVSEEKKTFTESLEAQPETTQAAVNRNINNWKTGLRRNLRRKFGKSSLFNLTKKFKNNLSGGSDFWIIGEEQGFKNITESASYINQKFLEETSISRVSE